MKTNSRALAAYIEMQTGVTAKVHSTWFEFDDDGGSVVGKRMWMWERDFQASGYAVFNQKLRTMGDQQRDLKQIVN